MTLTFSPKSILIKIAEVFQTREADTTKVRKLAQTPQQSNLPAPSAAKPKLNVSLDELKIISTALLHYRRNLAKMGEMERAENVGKIDKQFYHLIQDLEEQARSIEQEESYTKVAA